MIKLYRLMLVLICLAGFVFSAQAQWSDDLSKNLLISESGREGQDLVQIGKTSDNKVFIAWISWEDASAYVKLQLLDKEGNPLLGSGGMYVCKYPTPTFSSGFGFAVSKDDCALIVNSDTRNGTDDGWKPYLYKVSQKGEHMWSPEGFSLLPQAGLSGLDPHICVTSENNMIIGFRQLAKSGGSGKIVVTKYLADGSKAWGGNINVVEQNTIFKILPSGADGFIVPYYESFSTSAGNYVARKYTANGEEAWADKVYIDESGVVKVQPEPSLISDGEGGLITGYRYQEAGVNYGAVQRVTSEGEVIIKYPEMVVSDLPVVCSDPSGAFIYSASRTGSYGTAGVSLVKHSRSGERIWQNDELVSTGSWQYSLYGVVALENQILVVYRNAVASDDTTIEYSRVDPDGNTIEANIPVSTGKANKGEGDIAVLDDQYVLAWAEKVSQTGGKIYAQNVKWEKGSRIVSEAYGNETGLKLFQNSGGQYEVEINAEKEGTMMMHLVDCSGKTVATSEMHMVQGKNKFVYPVDKLLPGLYLLSVKYDSVRLSGKMFVE